MEKQSYVAKILDRAKAIVHGVAQIPHWIFAWWQRMWGSCVSRLRALGRALLTLGRALFNLVESFLRAIPGLIVLAGITVVCLIGFSIVTTLFQTNRPACETGHSKPSEPDKDGKRRVNLNQCWTDKERQEFYTTHEGSLVVPYHLVKHLELANSNELFLSEKTIEKLGLLPLEEGDFAPFSSAVDADGAPPRSPRDWPLGFVINDVQEGAWAGKWLGVTCAACHTGQVEYKGTKLRIDGGQAMADINWFLSSLHSSMEQLVYDGETALGVGVQPRDKPKDAGEKFKRYASKYPDKTPKQLLGELKAIEQAHESWHVWNDPDIRHGFGRLDAFGAIYNQLLNLAGTRESARPPNAPVSYPFLWDTSQHDWTQWNGISPRIPKGRNMGQVIGTFGKFEFPPSGATIGSIPLRNLRELQGLIDKLRSPAWPEDILGEIDKQKMATGRKLYDKKCLYCHGIQERNKPLKRINVHLADASVAGSLGTDPAMTFNAHNRKTQEPDGPVKIQSILLRTVVYVLLHPAHSVWSPFELLDTAVEFTSPLVDCTGEYFIEAVSQWKWGWKKCVIQDENKIFYKGRPLDGIWATAPYLHNGSVANLYELLLPEKERMEGFCVGSREFDPEHVGFETLVGRDRTKRNNEKSETECENRNFFWLNTALPGNRNTGHEYGVKWCDSGNTTCRGDREKEIDALIAYMKSL